MHHHAPLAVLPILFASAALAGGDTSYQFTIKQNQSGLMAALSANVQTSGTLIGNYDETANPTGTRTKPGLFGTFGATENVAIPTSLTIGVDQNITTRTSGAFGFTFNEAAGIASLDNFAADFLAGGSLDVPINLTILYESFRSRNPTSIYPGGIPITLPIGQAMVTSFSVTQVAPGVGTITRTGANTLDFTVAPLVQYDFTISVLGQEFTLPTTPLPFALSGTMTTSGDTAHITSMTPLVLDQSTMPGLAIPQFAFDLPTVLPPGSMASVLLDLTLSDVALGLSGQVTTVANGQLVPGPGVTGAMLIAGASVFTRRRRS